MKTPIATPHACQCTNCENRCRERGSDGAHPAPQDVGATTGFFARRPWIWLVLGQVVLISALATMVVIAIKFQQPDVLMSHGR